MADIRDKHNRHLFLEDKSVTHESFIANVNKAVEHLDDIADFNNIMGQEGVTEFVEAVLEELENATNQWVVVIEETAEAILESSSAFMFSTVITAKEDMEEGATITLPNILRYPVGTGTLMVTYNGAVCYVNEQYTEVGTVGDQSNQIILNFAVRCGDKIGFRTISLSSQDKVLETIMEKLSTDIPVIATDTETPRYLTDRFSDVINVKDFGAIGNEDVDDTPAFIKAYEYGESLGYPYVLYVPKGIFYVTELPDVPYYGTGTVVCNDTTYHPFELMFKINGGIIKDTNGRYKIDFDCLSNEDRITLLSQIVKFTEDNSFHSIFIDEYGKLYVDFTTIPLDVLAELIKDILGDGSGLDVVDGKLVVDIEGLDESEVLKLVYRLIKEKGGLAVDSDGKIYVDFSSMEKEDLITLIKQIITEDSGLNVDGDGKIYIDMSSLKLQAGDGIILTTSDENSTTVSVDETWLENFITGHEIAADDGITVSTSNNMAIIAVDDTVVRTNGEQTITGSKTFSGMQYFTTDLQIVGDITNSSDYSPDIDFQVKGFIRGDTPESHEATSSIVFFDGTNDGRNTGGTALELGRLKFYVDTNGTSGVTLQATQNVAESPVVGRIQVYVSPDGVAYATAPSTRSTPSNTDIVTVNYLTDQIGILDSNVVHLTGYEKISSSKLLVAPRISNDTAGESVLRMVNTTVSKGTTGRSIGVGQITFSAYANESVCTWDMGATAATHQLGKINNQVNEDGETTGMRLCTYSNDTSTTDDYAELSVWYNPEGSYATAPSTRSNPSSTEIVTVDYLTNQNLEININNSIIAGDGITVSSNGNKTTISIDEDYISEITENNSSSSTSFSGATLTGVFIPTSDDYTLTGISYGSTCVLSLTLPSGGTWHLYGYASVDIMSGGNRVAYVCSDTYYGEAYAGGTTITLDTYGLTGTNMYIGTWGTNLICLQF